MRSHLSSTNSVGRGLSTQRGYRRLAAEFLLKPWMEFAKQVFAPAYKHASQAAA
jgi:hypothetical protein